MFGLGNEHDGVSGRALLSFLIRRVSSHGFNEATRSFSRQSEADASTNLAYLLGLDWKLAGRYRDIAAREATRQQLRMAVNDPVWGRIVGSTADLRGQITIAEQSVSRLREEVAGSALSPSTKSFKSGQISLLARLGSCTMTMLLHALIWITCEAMEETVEAEVGYLDSVYREVGVILSDQVKKQYKDVERFHRSVVRNRRRYLSEELASVEEEPQQRRNRREALGREQTEILRTLNDGGALRALTSSRPYLLAKCPI